MKYKICWLEHHICDSEKDEKEWLDSLPPYSRITGAGGIYGYDVVEFECIDWFEADNVDIAKNYVREEYEYPSDDFEIFSVYDELGERVFTEEDM